MVSRDSPHAAGGSAAALRPTLRRQLPLSGAELESSASGSSRRWSGTPASCTRASASSLTNLRRSAKRVVAFYNGRGTAEQWIKEGKHAVKWTRLTCTTFRANAVRLQTARAGLQPRQLPPHAGAPDGDRGWSLTSLREKVVKIGAKVIAHGRYAIFQMAEVAVPRELFGRLIDRIARLRPSDPAPC